MSKEKKQRNSLIAKARKNGLSYRKIADRFGINVKSVFRIVKRLTYSSGVGSIEMKGRVDRFPKAKIK